MEARDKIIRHFEGRVVRKDLTKLIKGNAVVPTYVLEYLLGQHCASSDDEIIKRGIETVREIIKKHFVHRDEAQLIRSQIREKGSHRIIDKVAVHLNEKADHYEASFSNLALKNIPINDEIVKRHKKLLMGGVWCIAKLAYLASDDARKKPYILESLKPIQISGVDVEEYKEARSHFEKEEWMDLILHSMGLEPSEFNFRSKLIQLSRLIPFAENNYNLIELGPKGTGKSHIYSELSPHGILISGGEVTKAKLFVNNSNGNLGLVGYWDVVAYDEFAGTTKKPDKGLVDIMKNYMANRMFSRGTDVHTASASMVFVGNTDHTVDYMLKHTHLFESLPVAYQDSAFLDRIHSYLPGWEVKKLRSDMFSDQYGFIVDYLAEILKELRKEDFSGLYREHFDFDASLTTRDKNSIIKNVNGLLKIIFPHGSFSTDDLREMIDFGVECRMRVKKQLYKLDATFEVVNFQFTDTSSSKKYTADLLEEVNLGIKEQHISSQAGKEPHIELHDSSEDGSPIQESKIAQVNKATAGQVIIRDNQIGISYHDLFAPYFQTVTKVEIADPYVRFPYQIKNFMELMQVFIEQKNPGQIIDVHLITFYSEGYKEKALDYMEEIQQALAEESIHFSYTFDEYLHDRYIDLDNGWKIILGRGLDIFQKTNGMFDLAEYDQKKRKCRACEVTYLEQ